MIYTAAIWNTVARSVAEYRSHVRVYRIKCAYSICFGAGITAEEKTSILRRFDFILRFQNFPIANIECMPPATFSMLQMAPVHKLQWPVNYTNFLNLCLDIVREWTL